MKPIEVEVRQDHLERIANRRTPIQGLAELVWNAFDADAQQVHVDLSLNNLDGLTGVTVADDGTGISLDVAEKTFKSLGDSWKKAQPISPITGRVRHGQAGEGRFSAFALGDRVKWDTRFKDGNGAVQRFEITGHGSRLRLFHVSDPQPVTGPTGTVVTVTEFSKQPKSFTPVLVLPKLAETFALYLSRYPSLRLTCNGRRVDALELQEHRAELPIEGATDEEGNPIEAAVTVIEWAHKVDRELVLCDSSGFALATISAGIHAPGYNFTAYLRSDYVRDLGKKGFLELADMHPGLQKLLETGRKKMKDHFRARSAEKSASIVSRWKEEEVYPYSGTPKDPVEQVERQVFDIIALNVNEYMPAFAASDVKSRKFSLRMLKTALEQSPGEVRRIIQEVLELPDDKRAELTALLDKTTLSAIIDTSKVIVDRIDFLAGLQHILFDRESREILLERTQLHKILAENTWLFGEEYSLSVDDGGLRAVLDAHLDILRKPTADEAPVVLAEGGKGVVDLMLSRRIRQPRPDEFEHLVVELKRPKKDIDGPVIQQVEKYAMAVAKDERFRDSKVKWAFWAISNDMDEYARARANEQSDRPAGMIQRTPKYTIWVKTWSEVLEEAKGRMEFYRAQLNYLATEETGMERLRAVHAAYLPVELGGEQAARKKTSPDIASTATPAAPPATPVAPPVKPRTATPKPKKSKDQAG